MRYARPIIYLIIAVCLLGAGRTERARRIGIPLQTVESMKLAAEPLAQNREALAALGTEMQSRPFDAMAYPLGLISGLVLGDCGDTPFAVGMLDVFPARRAVVLKGAPKDLELALVTAMGIIDDNDMVAVKSSLENAGFDPLAQQPGTAWVVYMPAAVVPPYSTAAMVVIDPRQGDIVSWPLIELQAELNIAAYRWRIYRVMDSGRVLIADWPVIIGKSSRRTPRKVLHFDVIEHYPPWTDPDTGDYVSPGRHNPLGIWKLKSTHTRGAWYFHGTNQEWLLKRRVRAFSRGCIRNTNANIARLATLLLSHNAGEFNGDGLLQGRLDVAERRRTERIKLHNEVLISTRYDLVEVRQGESGLAVFFYPNIYGFRQENELVRLITSEHMLADLEAAGVDTELIDQSVIDGLVHKMRHIRRPSSISVEVLKVQPEPASAI